MSWVFRQAAGDLLKVVQGVGGQAGVQQAHGVAELKVLEGHEAGRVGVGQLLHVLEDFRALQGLAGGEGVKVVVQEASVVIGADQDQLGGTVAVGAEVHVSHQVAEVGGVQKALVVQRVAKSKDGPASLVIDMK